MALCLITLVGLWSGCQAPPSSAAPDATSNATFNASPKSSMMKSVKISDTSVSQDMSQSVGADIKPVQFVAQETPIETTSVVSEPSKQDQSDVRFESSKNAAVKTSPAVAAVDLATTEPRELVNIAAGAIKRVGPAFSPTKIQPTSPTKVAVEALKASPVLFSDAKIFVVDKVYDFGEVSPLERPEGTFHIKNIGTDVLFLTKVKLCCGAQYKLSSDTLKPGETSVLSVKYVATTIGPFEKYLNIFSNDSDSPDVKVTIKGKIVRRLAWTPNRFKLFLDKENGGCLPITISSLDGKPFALTSFTATEDCLVATVDPNKTAMKFVIQPKADLEKLGSLKIPKGVVRIKHTHPGCDVMVLNYDLFKRYAYTPKRFLVLNADPGKVRIQRLNILDNYADSLMLKQANGSKSSIFAIDSIDFGKGAAVLKSTKQIKDGYQLTFEISAPKPPARQRLFQDLITIKLSTGDQFEVPINGIYSMAALSDSKAR